MAKDKKEKKGGAQEEQRAPEVARHSAKETPRLKARFKAEIAPTLMKEFAFKNPMAVPHLHKIVVNMGMGEATQNAKILDPAVNELGQITGQKPVVTRAKKSIAAFKVRAGQSIGAMVTFVGTVCTNFSTVWSTWCCPVCVTFAAFPPSRSMAAATTRSACTIS